MRSGITSTIVFTRFARHKSLAHMQLALIYMISHFDHFEKLPPFGASAASQTNVQKPSYLNYTIAGL